jgi:hypothetical protein
MLPQRAGSAVGAMPPRMSVRGVESRSCAQLLLGGLGGLGGRFKTD